MLNNRRMQRLNEILRIPAGELTAREIVEKALGFAPKVRKVPQGFMLGEGVQSRDFSTRSRAERARYAFALKLAIEWSENGLAGLFPYGADAMPAPMRSQAESMLRKAKGIPRKKWKWSPEARQKLSESRKGQPRQRGYPLYSIGDPIPETGHRFTVTRETLEKLTLPEGM